MLSGGGQIMKGTIMANSRYSVLLAAAIALGSATAVQAADFYGGAKDNYYAGSIKDVAPPPPPAERSFYLKGYIGAHNHEIGDIYNPLFATGNFTVEHADMESGAFYGLGIGIDRGRWLRFDVTGEYRGKWGFNAHDRYINGPCGTPGNCGTNEYNANIESWVGLANAYVDFGNFGGFTPYVGAGVGFAHVSVNGMTDVNVPNNGFAYAADNSETNFAWAIHAGLSYDVTDRVAIDLGYRYLNIGDISSGQFNDFNLANPPSGGLEIDDVESHDLMLGIRFDLHRATAAPMMPISYK